MPQYQYFGLQPPVQQADEKEGNCNHYQRRLVQTPGRKGTSHAHLHFQVRDEKGIARLRRRSGRQQTPVAAWSLGRYWGCRTREILRTTSHAIVIQEAIDAEGFSCGVSARRRKPQSERPNCIFDLAWMMVRFARGPDDCATHGDRLQGPAGRWLADLNTVAGWRTIRRRAYSTVP